MIHQPQNIAVWLPVAFPTWENDARQIPAGEYFVRRCGEDETTGFLRWVEVDFRGDFGLEILTVLGDGLVTASGLALAGVLVRAGYQGALGNLGKMQGDDLVAAVNVLRRELAASQTPIPSNAANYRQAADLLLAAKFAYPTRPAIKALR